jgi:hypothetical protein
MNSNPATLVLQYRWKAIEVDSAPHLLYYGVRNPPAQRDILLPVSRELAELLDRSKGAPFEAPASLRAEVADLAAAAVLVPPAAWRAPAGQSSLLHTSCSLEPVKDYLQFQRFQAMRTVFMPQSLVELGAAVFFGLVNRADALQAVEELGYWQPPAILDQLADDLGIGRQEIIDSDDELRSGMRQWAELKA